MQNKNKLLWLADTAAPANVRTAAGGRWELTVCQPQTPLGPQLAGATLAVIYPNGSANDPHRLNLLLDELQRTAAVGVFLLPRDAAVAHKVLSQRPGQFLCALPDAPPDELAAQFSAAAAIQPALRDLHAQLSAARAANGDSSRIDQLDEEMRLAARLQRDFLPRRLPEVGPVRFAVLYQPATWVSGDIYDITRLDETHVGFYVADAVGHGMPAALLTMFIKKALQTKRILGNTYEIVPPHVSLGELNSDICQQNLSSCQFCTAAYCVLDVGSLTLTYCRAGHPEPLLIRDGRIERLTAPGSLLGVFPEETFESRQLQLASGDRLVLYTDGVEEILCRCPDGRARSLEEGLAEFAGLSRQEMLLQLTDRIAPPGGDKPVEDDITVLVMDVE